MCVRVYNKLMLKKIIGIVVLMKECGLATIWREWATNAFWGPRPVAWDQITLMLTGVQILQFFLNCCLIRINLLRKRTRMRARYVSCYRNSNNSCSSIIIDSIFSSR